MDEKICIAYDVVRKSCEQRDCGCCLFCYEFLSCDKRCINSALEWLFRSIGLSEAPMEDEEAIRAYVQQHLN